MRRIYNYGANIPLIGLVLEVCMLTLWLLQVRIKPNNRVPNFATDFPPKRNVTGSRIVINCRNFLRPEHSGVNVWVESICNELRNKHQITILCQGSLLFSKETIIKNDIEIKCLPTLKNLRLRKLPLNALWMHSVNKEIAGIKNKTTLITPMNLAAPFGLTFNEYVNQIVLLLTDDRRHKHPRLTIRQIKNEVKLNKRQKEIVRREKSILQNTRNSFIADSNAIVRELEELYEISISNRTQVNYIDIPKDGCVATKKEKTVLFVGRCDKRKGLNIYLDVYEKLRHDFPNWNFTVATSKGDDGQTYKRLHELRNRGNNLRIFLNINDEEKHKVLNSSAIALLPSYYESFGITGVEAMQHGCALISSRIGGIPEVVNDAGILVDPESAEEFEQQLREIMINEQKSIKLGKSAKLQALKLANQTKKFSIDPESFGKIGIT